MKQLSTILATLASILLILIIIFSMLQVTMNSETFINNEFTKLGTAKTMGMNNADLVRATMQLIYYMEGSVPSINIDVTINGEKTPMFQLEQEHSHMADVRTLYQGFRTGRDLGILVMLVLFLIAALMGFRRAGQTLATGYLSGLFACALVFGFVGMWALLDFSGFWTFFHQMLFWNEDWLFDATTSRMINMLEEQFFADIIGRMALYSLLLIGLLAFVSIIALLRIAAARRRARERAEAKRLAIIEQKRRQQEAEKRALEAAERGEPVEPEPEPVSAAAAEAEEAAVPAAAFLKRKRKDVIGDEIPQKPKDAKQKKKAKTVKKVKTAPIEKAKAKPVEKEKATPAEKAKEKRNKKGAAEPKTPVKKEKQRKLRRNDAPFELDLEPDPGATTPDGDDNATL